MSCRGLFGQVRKSISDRKDKMMDFLEENRIQLSEEGEVTTLTQFGSKCSSDALRHTRHYNHRTFTFI